jgi:hypothetical protein
MRYQSAHELTRDVQVILKSLDTASIGLNLSVPVPGPAVRVPVRDAPLSEVRSWLYAVAVLVGLVVFAGLTTSVAFNRGLGRTDDFQTESLFMQVFWGVRSMFAPAVLGVLAIIALGVVSAIVKVPMKMASPLTDRLIPPSTRTRVLASVYRTPMAVIAPIVLVIQLITLWLLWSRFDSLIWTLVAFINQSTVTATLGALNPANAEEHRSFRQFFSFYLLAFVAAWFQVLKLRAQRGDFDGRVVVAGGLAMTLFSLMLFAAPFRIMLHNEAERVAFASQRCYLVGQHDQDALLFCPNQPPPWSRVVRLDDPQLTRDGTRENMFKEVE